MKQNNWETRETVEKIGRRKGSWRELAAERGGVWKEMENSQMDLFKETFKGSIIMQCCGGQLSSSIIPSVTHYYYHCNFCKPG